MSAGFDLSRVVRSWLREDEHERADHVLELVLARLDSTPQRRSWWPARRSFHMTRLLPMGIAAAAVLVVAIVGFNLLPASNVGPPTGSPTPEPTASPATVAASPSVPPLPPSGDLAPGTYLVSSFTDRPLLVTVPSGWTHFDGNFITKGDAWDGNGVTMATWLVSHVYADSCDWEGTLLPVDSAASIVAALVAQQGHVTSSPSETTLGGVAATRLELSLDPSFDVAGCDKSIVRLWPDAGPQEQYGLPIYPGQTSVVTVVDDGSSAMLVVAVRNDDSAATDVSELNDVIASIEFVP